MLTTAATLERGYQALSANTNPQVRQPRVDELDALHRQWLSDLDRFQHALRAQGTDPRVLASVDDAFGRLAERVRNLAG